MSKAEPDDPTATGTGGDDGSGGEREHGTVRWFDRRRGFGFIARDAAVDVFFHASAVAAPSPLVAGERVSFVVADAPRGLQAVSIRRDRAVAGDDAGTSGDPPA